MSQMQPESNAAQPGRYDTVLFDLDGTLTDPGEGITNAVMFALGHYGISIDDRRTLYPFIGPPLTDSFMRYFAFSQEQAQEAISWYRVYFADRGLFENEVYPGISEMLTAMRNAGKTLAVATSKPAVFAERILVRFGLREYFDGVFGSELDGTRVKKAEVIRYAMDTLCIKDPARVLMVGDREHDVLGAKQCGIGCLGVLFGYGSRAELEAAGAIALAARVEDVAAWILQK